MWESNASPATVATRSIKGPLLHVNELQENLQPTQLPHCCKPCCSPSTSSGTPLAIKATQTRENRNSNRASWLVRVNHPRCGHVPESSYKLSHSANRTPAAWHHQQGPGASRKAVRMLPAGSWEALGKRDPSSLLTGSTRPACCTHSPGLLNDGLIFLPMLFLKDTRARNFHSTMEHNHF